jgi:ABC-type amino acid transport substrate-binding protein
VWLSAFFPPRRFDLRLLKYAVLIISLVFTAISCGNKEKEVASAAESMEKNKLVRIITDAVDAPFEYGSGTGVQGLDIDIGNEIGKDLGIEVKWVKVSGYEHLFELLKNGEAEILISAVAIDPKKSEEFAFSKPYFDSGDAIAHQRNKYEIKNLASLSGKKVGVATGRPGDSFMATQKTATGVAISKFPTLDDALGALNRAEIDAVVGDEPLLTYSCVKSYDNTILLPGIINKYQYGVVVRKNETELLERINKTLDRLKASGDLEALNEKWFDNVAAEMAQKRNKDLEEVRLRKSAKTISVVIQRISGAFSMDRLDGFVLVLEGQDGKYQSTPILTDGNKGNCKFNQPVPPGEYRLAMNIFKMVTKVTVPDLAKSSLLMDMKVSSGGISITLR